jgi:uncharacterized protein (DUF2267 family)
LQGYHCHKKVVAYGRFGSVSSAKAVEKKMPRFYPKPPSELLKGVFETLNEFISAGEIRDVKSCFSQEIRDFWPAAAPKKKKAA